MIDLQTLNYKQRSSTNFYDHQPNRVRHTALLNNLSGFHFLKDRARNFWNLFIKVHQFEYDIYCRRVQFQKPLSPRLMFVFILYMMIFSYTTIGFLVINWCKRQRERKKNNTIVDTITVFLLLDELNLINFSLPECNNGATLQFKVCQGWISGNLHRIFQHLIITSYDNWYRIITPRSSDNAYFRLYLQDFCKYSWAGRKIITR